MVAYLGVDEVFLTPWQVDELLLRWQVEIEQALDEFCALQLLKSRSVD